MSWQPIETAPKDGTFFDAWVSHTHGEGRRVVDAYFDEGRFQAGFYDRDGSFDLEWSNKGMSGEIYGEVATHWMAIPNPPKEDN